MAHCVDCLCVFSGGLPVTVYGSNLNAVQQPLISVTVRQRRRRFHDVRTPRVTSFSFVCVTSDFYYSGLGRGAEHCVECLSVCMSVLS